MNRKSFLILLGLLVVLGGLGLALFWQDITGWNRGDANVGTKLFENLPINDVARIHVYDAQGEATVEIKDQRWVVKERADYPASYPDISDLLIKLPDVKIVQSQDIGASLLPRLNLVEPVAKSGKDADTTGTVFELFDKKGTSVSRLLLGKKVIKTEDSPLPIKPQKEVGRFILKPGTQSVLNISDALSVAEAKPARWLAKDFFKVDRVKSVTYTGAGSAWKIARSEEFAPWKFAEGAGDLNFTASGAVITALGSLSFNDVAPEVKPESFSDPRTIVAETYDNLVYTIKVAKKPDSEDYYLSFTVTGEPSRTRTPEKGEKPEDKEKEDKYFVADLKKLDDRLKLERSLTPWTFVVAAKTLDPILRDRAQLVAPPRKPEPRGK